MNILFTRPSLPNIELVNKLKLIGKYAWHLPLIEFLQGSQLSLLINHLKNLKSNDLHAIHYTHAQLMKMGMWDLA